MLTLKESINQYWELDYQKYKYLDQEIKTKEIRDYLRKELGFVVLRAGMTTSYKLSHDLAQVYKTVWYLSHDNA